MSHEIKRASIDALVEAHRTCCTEMVREAKKIEELALLLSARGETERSRLLLIECGRIVNSLRTMMEEFSVPGKE